MVHDAELLIQLRQNETGRHLFSEFFRKIGTEAVLCQVENQYNGNPPVDLDDKEIWTDLWMSRIGNYPLGTKIIRSQGHARNKFANRIKYSMSK